MRSLTPLNNIAVHVFILERKHKAERKLLDTAGTVFSSLFRCVPHTRFAMNAT